MPAEETVIQSTKLGKFRETGHWKYDVMNVSSRGLHHISVHCDRHAFNQNYKHPRPRMYQ